MFEMRQLSCTNTTQTFFKQYSFYHLSLFAGPFCYDWFMPNTNKAQAWDSCDEEIRQFILDIVDTLKNQLGDNLVSIYLHGSLAPDSYYCPKSA